ncbi:hypothetical protein [Lignipirellula cremea]|uniref:hypothetical protein n=1 Tax=Lignipirellula cremea TaxID=2528010 RepID=UPI0011A12B48|nr:hypothetical protein [Lignipirellula cremea]
MSPEAMDWQVRVIDLSDCDEVSSYMPIFEDATEVKVLAVGGESFTDKQLLQLTALKNLQLLILDCTNVSEEGLWEFSWKSPHVLIRLSQRRLLDRCDWSETCPGYFGNHRPFSLLPRELSYLEDDGIYGDKLMFFLLPHQQSHFVDAVAANFSSDADIISAAKHLTPSIRRIRLQGSSVTDNSFPALYDIARSAGPLQIELDNVSMSKESKCLLSILPHVLVRDWSSSESAQTWGCD